MNDLEYQKLKNSLDQADANSRAVIFLRMNSTGEIAINLTGGIHDFSLMSLILQDALMRKLRGDMKIT